MQIPGGFFPLLSDISTAATPDIMEKSQLNVLKVKFLTCLVSGVPNTQLDMECDHRADGFNFHEHILDCHAEL